MALNRPEFSGASSCKQDGAMMNKALNQGWLWRNDYQGCFVGI